MGFGTGHGVTLTFSGQGVIYAVRQADPMRWEGPSPNVNNLNTGFYGEFLPPDIVNGQPWNVQFLWDTVLPPPQMGVRDTLTLQHPLALGEIGMGAKWEGFAWLTGFDSPGLASNQENVGGMRIQWESTPTYTPATGVVAFAFCETRVAVSATVDLTGSGSVGADAYQWNLIEKPAASNATITSPIAADATIQPDVAGRYVAQLVATNTGSSVSDADLCSFQAS